MLPPPFPHPRAQVRSAPRRARSASRDLRCGHGRGSGPAHSHAAGLDSGAPAQQARRHRAARARQASRAVLGELAGLSARLLERGRPQVERATGLLSRGGYHEGIALPELETIATILTLIRELAAIAMRSSKPPDYLRLLSRPGVDIERFVSTMSFFANDRHVRLKALDMERRRVALQMERCADSAPHRPARPTLAHRGPDPRAGTGHASVQLRLARAACLRHRREHGARPTSPAAPPAPRPRQAHQ